jgi:hypothetical protein
MKSQIQSASELDHQCRLFYVSHVTYWSRIHNSELRLRRIRLNWGYESPAGRANPGHQKKEVYGVGCKNRIYVKMKFDDNKKFVSREIEHGEYIEETP